MEPLYLGHLSANQNERNGLISGDKVLLHVHRLFGTYPSVLDTEVASFQGLEIRIHCENIHIGFVGQTPKLWIFLRLVSST